MMNDPEIRYQILTEKMMRRGLRLTSHRLAIARLLSVSDEHPNAASLYQMLRLQFPSISLATVYKTLTLLKEEGEVLQIDLSGDNHYDGNKPYSHPHLVCRVCQRIFDGDAISSVGALEAEISETYGFLIQSHQIVYYGICRDCLAKEPAL
jgi:Fur family transcriptional regulator, peroxide stress response regulator